MNETANGRVIRRRNWRKIAVIVLLALAVASLCLQTRVISTRTPDFWTAYLFLGNFHIQVFSGERSGTGVIGTLETSVSADAILARQVGIVYYDGRWEFIK